MAKITIKGNNWMPQKWQDRTRKTKRFVPLLVALLGVLCLTAGVVLAGVDTMTMTQVHDNNYSIPGSVTTVTISSTQELQYFDQYLNVHSNFFYKKFKLTADITLPEDWSSPSLYGNWTLVFDGNGHTIRGVRLSQTSDSAVFGLFQYLERVKVYDLTVDGETITGSALNGKAFVGGITGRAWSVEFKNCVNKVRVSAFGTWEVYVGGIAGEASNCTFNGCTNEAQLIGNYGGDDVYVGGIVGYLHTEDGVAGDEYLINCVNNGNISAWVYETSITDSMVGGGIVGGTNASAHNADMTIRVENCVNNGAVEVGNTSRAYAGGIFGRLAKTAHEDVYITDCRNTGFVYALAQNGQYSPDSLSYAGGILGYMDVGLYTTRPHKDPAVTTGTSLQEDLSNSGRSFDACSNMVRILRCENQGTISHGGYAGLRQTLTEPGCGGIVGYCQGRLMVVDTVNYGDVKSEIKNSAYYGGIIGVIGGNEQNIGSWDARWGIVSLYGCANYGSSDNANYGGLVGCNEGLLRASACFSAQEAETGDAILVKVPNGELKSYNDGGVGYFSMKYVFNKGYSRTNGAETTGHYWYDIAPDMIWNFPETDEELVELMNIARSAEQITPYASVDTNIGTDTPLGETVTDNPLYWGYRYNTEDDNPAVLGQKLDLTFPKALGNDVQKVLLKQEGELAYELERQGDIFTSGGLLPGDYEVFLLKTLQDGTTEEVDTERSITVVPNAALSGSTDRYHVTIEVDYEFYTVTFMNGDAVFTTSTVLGGRCVEEPAETPEKDINHGFVGWSEKENSDKLFDFSEPIRGDKTLYAVWEELDRATIDVKIDGVTYLEEGAVTLRQESETRFTMPVSDRGRSCYESREMADGLYDIYLDGVFTGRTLTVKDSVGYASVTAYSVTFYTDEETVYHTEQRVFNSAKVSLPVDPTRAGFLFRGWYTEPECATQFDTEAGIDHITKLYAKWEAITGAVVDVTLDGEPMEADVALYQSNEWRAQLLSNGLTGDKHRYINDTVADGTYDIFVNGLNSSRTITVADGSGGATVSYFTVTMVSEKAATQTELCLSGETFTPPTPAYPRSHFRGWYLNDTFETPYDAAKPVTGRLTIYAKWDDATGAAVRVNVDGVAAESAVLALGQNGDMLYQLQKDTAVPGRFYVFDVPDGVYDIYWNNQKSGRTIIVKEGDGEETLNYYSVTFDPGEDAQSQVATATVLAGDCVAAPQTPVKKYNAFAGWYSAPTGGEEFDFSRTVQQPIYLYAHWDEGNGVQVYVNLNDTPYDGLQAGDLSARIDPDFRQDLSAQSTGRYGYGYLDNGTYTIYYKDTNTGIATTVTDGFGEPVTVDLYTATVHYGYREEGAASEKTTEQTLLKGQTAAVPIAPEREGYVFRGWYTDQECLTAYAGLPITKETHIYAKWAARSGITVYASLDGAPYADMGNTDLSVRMAPNVQEYLKSQNNGYYVNGMLDDGTYSLYYRNTDTGFTSTVVDGSGTSIDLQFFTATIHYGYEVGGSERISVKTLLKGQTFALGVDPIRDGYVFKGWFTDETFTTPYSEGTPLTAITHIYAKWMECSGVKVYVSKNGRAFDGLIADTDLTLRMAPNIEECLTATGSGIYTGASLADGTYSLYYKGEDTGLTTTVVDGTGESLHLEFFTATLHYGYKSGSSERVTEKTVLKGQTLSMPVDPSHSGYVFKGWFADEEMETPYVAGTAVTAETHIYAKWAACDGVKVYISLDGTANNDLATGSDLTLRMPPDVEENLTFQGKGTYAGASLADGTYSLYYKGEDTGMTTTVVDGTGESLHLEFFTATLHYGYNIGMNERATTQKLLKGQSAKLPVSPNRSGYVFRGWFADEELEMPYESGTPVTKTTAIYAKWQEITGVQITVTLDGKAQSDMRVTLRQENEVIYTLESASGVYQLESGVEAADGTYEIFVNGANTNRTLEVVDHSGSAAVSYATVTFYDGDNKVLETQQVLVGDTATEPAVSPTKIGNNFQYWKDAGGSAYDFSAPVESALSLYPNWAENTYTVSVQIEHMIYNGDTKATYDTAVKGKIEPEDGYLMPDSISATMGGEPFTSFKFDKKTGEISIEKNVVTGDIVFTGSGVEVVEYTVTSEIRNSVLYGAVANTKDGYIGTLRANAGFALPTKLTATAGGKSFTDFRYDAKTGKITVTADKLQGDLCFSGECTASLSAISYKLRSAIGNGALDTTEGNTAEVLVVHVIPRAGYGYPKALALTMNGRRFVGFTYDSTTGELRIPSGQANGTLMVLGTCSVDGKASKTLTEQPVITKKLHE